MAQKDTRRPTTVIVVAVFALGLAGLVAWEIRDKTPPAPEPASGQFVMPELSVLAQTGKTAFDTNCTECHGANALGSDKGPPLIHDIYQPGHHGDQSFRLAPVRGVSAHHWPFGDMPPMPQVTDDDMTGIIAYIREVQRANGIVEHAHRMNMGGMGK